MQLIAGGVMRTWVKVVIGVCVGLVVGWVEAEAIAYWTGDSMRWQMVAAAFPGLVIGWYLAEAMKWVWRRRRWRQ